MPDGHVRVGLFPTLSETIVCQLGTVAELPRTATKSWKSGKKTAFRAAKAAAAASKESPAASKESPAASSSKDSARKKRKAAQKSHKLSFDGYIHLLAAKIEEGNKTKGNKDQRRGADGKFGNKNLLDCSWRTWLKSMFTEYPGVLCKCSCNHRPLTSAQALIKHIERNHYINNVVSFGEEDLEFTPPQF
ncbi:uncharacterized protein LOC128159770 [Crassostrea angulata]|uniref:uncharacterized protein LOC128159770 n=1 Tax=Magallana angulata TaxID=2784310 RepID=UPI0022B0ECC4|nr:uncharacterized protein LOC128159770 [Crassostrea angulata]